MATNAILERKGARIAYVTTRGFRDIPFLQRGHRQFHYDRYLHDMGERFMARGIAAHVVLMKSNGGEMNIDAARQQPIHLALSGPTGGVVAAREIAVELAMDNVVTLDMGGTSTDCSTISGGKISFTTSFEIEFGVPIQLPMIDIRTIGAGGGSIAKIDKGGMPLLIRSCLQEIPLAEIAAGDVLVHNDPYRGGLHTPEHTLFCPVVVDGEILAFTVAIGHIAEVGGMVPGGFPAEATEIFHEGIRVPPVKIKKRGHDVPEVWKLWLANVRTPRYNYGDMRALISGVETGVARLS